MGLACSAQQTRFRIIGRRICEYSRKGRLGVLFCCMYRENSFFDTFYEKVEKGNEGKWCYSTFLFSAPGVVTITLSGVITSAPLAVAAPLNMLSTACLKVSTISPSVR